MRRSLVEITLIVFALSIGCSQKPTAPAQKLDFKLHSQTIPPGTVDERVKKAEVFAKNAEHAKAIEVLEEAMFIDAKDRTLLRMLVENTHKRFQSLVYKDDANAYRMIVTSSEYLRMLREAHPNATDDEKRLAVNVLYDEATSHARSLRVEETTGALRGAFAAGFRDYDRLEKSPDWDAIRKVPEFKKEYDELMAARKKL